MASYKNVPQFDSFESDGGFKVWRTLFLTYQREKNAETCKLLEHRPTDSALSASAAGRTTLVCAATICAVNEKRQCELHERAAPAYARSSANQGHAEFAQRASVRNPSCSQYGACSCSGKC
jgi:hypothetical protein